MVEEKFIIQEKESFSLEKLDELIRKTEERLVHENRWDTWSVGGYNIEKKYD